MSLYNMVMGINPLAGEWLVLLGKEPADFGRLRDVWLQDDGPRGIRIVVLTRCGGNNRDDYEAMFTQMREHPLYLGDRDDDYDSTYALIEFSFPESERASLNWMLEEVEGARDRVVDNRPLKERWEAAMAAMRGPSN